MARATHLVDLVYRYEETVAPTGTTDQLHILQRVAGSTTATRLASAKTLAGGNGTGQLQNMDPVSANARGSNCIFLTSTETAL